VHISEVNYLGQEEEESSDEEEEEEEEEGGEEAGSLLKKAKGKGRSRQRGGQQKNGGVRIKDGVKLPPKRLPPQIRVKLDAMVVKPICEEDDEWDVELAVGSHMLEMGEEGGVGWKVHVDRPIA